MLGILPLQIAYYSNCFN